MTRTNRLGDGVVSACLVGVLAIVSLAASSATRRVRTSSDATCPAPSEASRAESVSDRLPRKGLPPKLLLPTGLRVLAEDVWRGSATFKRQCARLADVSAPTVTVRTGIRPLGSLYRAHTSFTRKGGILVGADVWIALQDDSVELLAHELEHVIEALDRVDLVRLADRRDAGVTFERDGHMETRRAVAVGKIVAREFRAPLVAEQHSVWHHTAGQILTPAALTTSPDRTCVPGAPRSAAAFVLSPSGLAPSVVLRVAQGIRAGVSSGPATVNVSADGRVVAFESHVPLLSADTNGVSDIYVLDLRTRDLTLASQTPDGSASNGSSTHPGLSADGRYIVFESLATNLVAAPDLNRESDIFVRDSHATTTSRISVPPGGGSTNGWSRNPVIAADGDSVAFDSVATNLSPGLDANGYGSDVYVFHVSTGLVRRVSVTTSGAQPSSGVSFAPAISADGRFIAFTSRAELGCALRPTSEPQRGATLPSHVYVRDLGALVTHCVSGGTRDRPGKGSSYHAAIDHAGRMVAFVSEATNLGIQDRNHAPDVYLYDLVTDATRLVTRSVRGRPASGDSLHPAISGNGRFVVFESAASDLVCARGCPGGTVDHNLVSDVYIFDVATDGITRLSTGNGNEPWWQASRGPALSADGSTIAFSSRHPVSRGDVVDDDDLFVLMSCVLSAPPHEVRTESVSAR